ncbi:hypothetical protein MNBD_GAMMA18-2112 [hydrothermal vent metagenome]|uniref:Uncharacterized protein n=1 Tax=hydrothermal vent metagenome TaxID=652676 RepID=A0A3B0Z2T4_9ZZZZ
MITRDDIFQKINVYSWGAEVEFTLNGQGGFKDFNGVNESLLWNQEYILTLKPREIHPQLQSGGITGYTLKIEATDTASSAESVGIRLAYALLCLAINKHWGMSLSWPDSPLPCRVIDRTKPKGITGQGFAFVTNHVEISEFVSVLESSFDKLADVPYQLLLSMELCASSRLESNNRSKLIMLVSSFEALAIQRNYSTELSPLIRDLKSLVKEAEIEDESLKNSILGQIEGLKHESIRRAIRRLMNDIGLGDDDCQFVDKAYKARSKIVHEGQRVPELDIMTTRIDLILRHAFSVVASHDITLS